MMLGTQFEETRVYQETRAEERQAISMNRLKEHLPLEQIVRLTRWPPLPLLYLQLKILDLCNRQSCNFRDRF
jgi:hypothetical protein